MTNRTLRTDRLNFAAYVLATNSLPLVGLEEVRPGSVEFIFNDPDGRGPDLEFAYKDGATVSAIRLFASVSKLRDMISTKLSRTKTTGDYYDRRNNATTR
jgi:hypothetical protein